MVWVIAFGELFFGDLWCVVWGYGGMRTHFSLLNPACSKSAGCKCETVRDYDTFRPVGSGGECITTFDQEK